MPRGKRGGLAKRPGKKVPRRGRVKRIRRITPKPGHYINVRVVSRKGKRGGTTVAGPVHRVKQGTRKQ